MTVKLGERGDRVRLLRRTAVDPLLVARIAVYVASIVPSRFARADIQVPVECAHREGEQSVAWTTAIGPAIRCAILIDTELQLTQVRLGERDSSICLQGKVKPAPQAHIILTNYVSGCTVICRIGEHPSCHSKIVVTQPEMIVVGNLQPRCSAIESGASWNSFRWTCHRKVDSMCSCVKTIAGDVPAIAREWPVRNEAILCMRG